MECAISEEHGIRWLNVSGRIDGMTSGDIRRRLQVLIDEGQRVFTVNFEAVNYISSAGLRVFLEAQKQLNRVGGEIYLFGLRENVLDVFEMSGFMQLFKAFSSREEIEGTLTRADSGPEAETLEIKGGVIQCIRKEGPPGALRLIGSQKNLLSSNYGEKDVETLKAGEIQFGLGMATLGDEYEEYKNLFGGALVINRNLFFYPAVRHPVVDFMLRGQGGVDPAYRFLNGVGFSGTFHHILSFESRDGFFELSGLIKSLSALSTQNVLGVVLLAESKGFWGMNMKRAPITENKPENGKHIMDEENFSEWMNFPLEPGEVNHIIACAGIAVKDRSLLEPRISELLAKDQAFHFHGGVFAKGPLGKDVGLFERELERVLTEVEISKVQHMLAQSRLGGGMAGIIELKG
ncbi:MAG: STAS domain-containing protein [Pseudomonadota bacterium]